MGIYKDKTTKGWTYKFEYLGRSYGGRGYATRREAEAARVKRRDEVKAQSVATHKEIRTATGFKAVANDYLDYAERKYVRDVYLRKVNVCKQLRASLPNGDLPVDQITPFHVHNYLKTLKSNSLYNEHRQELSALFNWVKKIYSFQFPFFVNPCTGIESMTHVPAEKSIPTEKDVLGIIAASKPGDEQDIILTCLHTLGRIDEVLRLRWHEDVNFDKRYVVLWTRKRKNGAYEPDALPMNQTLYDVLFRRWKARKQGTWVFFNAQTGDRYYHRPKMMAAICQRAGIKPIGVTKRKISRGKKKDQYQEVPVYYGFHSLRHFMASYLMDEEKVSLKTVSGLLRHKNVRTTEIYLHSVDSSQEAAANKMEEKFTLKLSKPPQPAATEKEGVTS
jgi:integrase